MNFRRKRSCSPTPALILCQAECSEHWIRSQNAPRYSHNKPPNSAKNRDQRIVNSPCIVPASAAAPPPPLLLSQTQNTPLNNQRSPIPEEGKQKFYYSVSLTLYNDAQGLKRKAEPLLTDGHRGRPGSSGVVSTPVPSYLRLPCDCHSELCLH